MQLATVCATSIDDIVWEDWPVSFSKERFVVIRYHLPAEHTPGPDLYALLQPDEHERAGRYRRKEDQNRFLYGRAMTRVCLGCYTGQKPTYIQFVSGINKKPELAGGEGIYFNLSHAGNWILLVMSGSPVGIDVEKVNPDFPFQDILPNSFSPEEQRWIINSNNPEWRFYQLWTRKEALIKATGKGIDDDFRLVPSLAGKHAVAPGSIGDDGSWTVAGFNVDANSPAAVAYRTAGKTPKFYSMKSGFLGII